MEEARRPDPAAGSHLIVLARGIGAEDLVLGPLAGLVSTTPMPMLAPGDDPAQELLAALPAEELRRLGIGVDRRSLLWQPRWRSDEQAVRLIGARPLGPAHVTLLDLSGPLRAAATAGSGTASVRTAVASLAADIGQALATIARRARPHLWLVALGAPVAVAHVLDVDRQARRIVGWPYARMLRVRQTGSSAHIRATGHRALEVLRRRLHDSVLGGATVREVGHGLQLLAPPCTAFGRSQRFARQGHPGESAPAAALPWRLHTADTIDIAGIAARVTMAAASTAVDRRRRHQAATVAAPTTELLPLFSGGVLPARDPWQLEPSEFDLAAFAPGDLSDAP